MLRVMEYLLELDATFSDALKAGSGDMVGFVGVENSFDEAATVHSCTWVLEYRDLGLGLLGLCITATGLARPTLIEVITALVCSSLLLLLLLLQRGVVADPFIKLLTGATEWISSSAFEVWIYWQSSKTTQSCLKEVE